MDRQVPIPLYYQIRSRVLESIESGQLKPGDRVPSERELTERFGVSRMTARQAVSELENQGYLYRIQGKGTYVAAPKLDQPLVGLTSFSQDMRRRGLEPGALVLSAHERPAGALVGRSLGLTETTPVYQVERLRLAGGEPMALETACLPVDLCPGLLETNLEHRSLYEVLRERFGLHLLKAAQRLEAVAASAREADLLRVHEGTPLLMLERVSRDASDLPVEYVRSLYRGDRYRFVTELMG
ncbi:MAG TPA: GntR family transcriptional regulator [Symbiobacteriaceae bacterium]|nr:GntR family transcriptional regulator [Symbiobacteriaceae bacterium]